MELEQKFSTELDQVTLSSKVNKILVAVSGGVDSLALCFLVEEYCQRNDIEFCALTIEHGLREDSKYQAEELQRLLANHQIHHDIVSWEKDGEITSNIEAQARVARYELICSYAKEQHVDLVLIGHHRDDQIENFLIRLERGSGLDGLSLMDRSFSKGGVNFMRPLIAIRKSELQNYLEEKQINWFEDSSNKDTKFKRNQIRELLENLEDGDLIKQRIYQTASHFSRIKSYISEQVDITYLELVTKPDGDLIVELAKFKKLHSEIALRLLIKIFAEIGNKPYKPRFEKLENLYKKIIQDQINKRTTFAYTIIEVKPEYIMFRPEF
ncbi:MAG: tRNA lysidine(34) synthetase TilS [Rickettsiales bacterium]|jgi:tRNA(Ile)-lysidine synthase|nr:tRNA lysidine(34) synthetase TilS [Rickettsiales bacterium]